jgi:hypothetical protein
MVAAVSAALTGVGRRMAPPGRRFSAACAGWCPANPVPDSRDTRPARGSSGGVDGLEDDGGHDQRGEISQRPGYTDNPFRPR